MTRSELRKNIFKIIFRMEFHQDEAMDEQLSLRLEELEEEGIQEKELAYIGEKDESLSVRQFRCRLRQFRALQSHYILCATV